MGQVKSYPNSIVGKEKVYAATLFNDKGYLIAAALAGTPTHLKKQLIDCVHERGLITENYSEALFWIMNDYFEYPKTCECGNKITKFHSYSRGYPHSRCSTKCSNNNTTVKDKKQKAFLEKHGVEHPGQIETGKRISREKLIERLEPTKEAATKAVESQGFDVLVTGETLSDDWTFRCKECLSEFSTTFHTWQRWNTNWRLVCPTCNKGSSAAENEIAAWISAQGFDPLRRDRKLLGGKEIDIYIPSLNLGIEYNGSYRHSNNKHKHLDKLNLCIANGIKLIQITDYEWDEKRDIVKSRLSSALGLNRKIAARNTEVVPLSYSETAAFFKKHHIQGSVPGCLYLGLKYEDQIVHAISIGKARFAKIAEYELLRSASIAGITIVGGLGKLISHARKNLDAPIITYADRNWGEGKSYEKIGAKYISSTPPGYLWWKYKRRLSRYATQKSRLPHLLGDKFNPAESEETNMKRCGWNRLWNCGNNVYLFQ